MANPLSYAYSYAAYAKKQDEEIASEQVRKMERVIKAFSAIRGDIYQLCYDAEQIDDDLLIRPMDATNAKLYSNTLAEFELIRPVIKELARAAEFITQRELADWKENNE